MKARIVIGVMLLVVLLAELFLGAKPVVSAGEKEIFKFSISNVRSELDDTAKKKERADSVIELFGVDSDLDESASINRMQSALLIGLNILAAVLALIGLIGLLRGNSHFFLMLLGIGAMILDVCLCRNYVEKGTLELVNVHYTDAGKTMFLLAALGAVLFLAGGFCPRKKRTESAPEAAAAQAEVPDNADRAQKPAFQPHSPVAIPAAPETAPAGRRCPNCGKDLPETAEFCSGCGTPVSRSGNP